MDGPVNSDRLAEVEQMYRTYFPSALFSYFYLDDYQDSLYKSDRNFGWILPVRHYWQSLWPAWDYGS